MVFGYYWPETCKAKLILLLEEYINVSYSFANPIKEGMLPQKVSHFLDKFYSEMLALKKEIFAS